MQTARTTRSTRLQQQEAFAKTLETERKPSYETQRRIEEAIRANPDLINPKFIRQYIRGYPEFIFYILSTGRIPVKTLEAAFSSLKNDEAQFKWIMYLVPNRMIRDIQRYHIQKMKKMNPKKKCNGMHATLFINRTTVRQLRSRREPQVRLRPARIQRKKVINAIEGPRQYEPLTMDVVNGNVPALVKWKLKTHPIASCKYTPNIAIPNASMIIVEDVTGYIVAAASFYIDKKTLIVDYLCSAKLCKGGGTAVMRALEVYAKRRGCTYIELGSDKNAVPFYLRSGFSSMVNNNIQNGPPVITRPNGTKALNYTPMSNTMRKKL